jgi:hypothetical protein
MTRVFDVSHVPDVPTTGQDGVLLRARVDLDLATHAAARAEMLDAVSGPGGVLVLDLAGACVGAVFVSDLVALSEYAARRGTPVAVVAAPPWLVALTTRLDMPPLRFADTVAAAVQALRTAIPPGTPRPHRHRSRWPVDAGGGPVMPNAARGDRRA